MEISLLSGGLNMGFSPGSVCLFYVNILCFWSVFLYISGVFLLGSIVPAQLFFYVLAGG